MGSRRANRSGSEDLSSCDGRRADDLRNDLRRALVRLGTELVLRRYLLRDTEFALEQLQQALTRANRIQAEAPFGDSFAESYLRLREKAEALVAVRRGLGHGRDDTVAHLKQVFHDTIVPGLPPEARSLVESDIIRWGVKAYEAA